MARFSFPAGVSFTAKITQRVCDIVAFHWLGSLVCSKFH